MCVCMHEYLYNRSRPSANRYSGLEIVYNRFWMYVCSCVHAQMLFSAISWPLLRFVQTQRYIKGIYTNTKVYILLTQTQRHAYQEVIWRGEIVLTATRTRFFTIYKHSQHSKTKTKTQRYTYTHSKTHKNTKAYIPRSHLKMRISSWQQHRQDFSRYINIHT